MLRRSASRAIGSLRHSQRSIPLLQHRVRRASSGPGLGKLDTAVLDWSGTVADIFVIAPADAFVEAFKKHGVEISMQEARVPMGLRKDLHIKALTEMPEIAQRWKAKHGSLPGDKEVAAIFKDFIPAQMECLPKYTGLIDGAADAVNRLRSMGMKIGNTTGFQRVMVDVLLRDAKRQGYVPDVSVAGDEVTRPRPYPYMVFRNMMLLDSLSVHKVVKVDDTVAGVGEGLNAGTWAVGLYETSNYMDINSYEEWRSMSKGEFRKRAEKSKQILMDSGAHYIIPTIKDLPAVCEDINRRLARGERPSKPKAA